MNNYNSVCCPEAREKVESTLNDEITVGNYTIVPQKLTIISALGAVPKADSDDLRLIHDCSMPPGKEVIVTLVLNNSVLKLLIMLFTF